MVAQSRCPPIHPYHLYLSPQIMWPSSATVIKGQSRTQPHHYVGIITTYVHVVFTAIIAYVMVGLGTRLVCKVIRGDAIVSSQTHMT